MLLYMRLEKIFYAAHCIKAVEGVERDRFWHESYAVNYAPHITLKPLLEPALSGFSIRKLQFLNCQQLIVCIENRSCFLQFMCIRLLHVHTLSICLSWYILLLVSTLKIRRNNGKIGTVWPRSDR